MLSAAAACTIARASGCSESDLERGRKGEDPFAGDTGNGGDLCNADLTCRERPGLIKHHCSDPPDPLERFCILDEHPMRAPAPVPTMIAAGVARPSAHGHAMISTAIAWTSA